MQKHNPCAVLEKEMAELKEQNPGMNLMLPRNIFKKESTLNWRSRMRHSGDHPAHKGGGKNKGIPSSRSYYTSLVNKRNGSRKYQFAYTYLALELD